ncbi:sulfite exporter TauE/SafE family protein [Methylococcus sp. EFPC2]|uniref:sulfite exporter TauE/SafE family protein n=1 Tax=Methylococcus sp. EFPC2 TaxID=2812648 RepID=UPI001968737E|nr:sulfite exporter TauE/SafE family protein [Methylococcus sp. EFPC2]QSA96747.1 sulfite exporter TauE/SafE family protein [Methylococcus sp. EFPC2]
MFETWAYYLAFGSLAGVLSGLLGIGGGVVVVPFLIWRLTLAGCPPDLVMIVAVATSLATIVVTSMSAVYTHHRLGALRWSWIRRMTPGIVLGTAVGSVIAERLPAGWFKLLFALFLIFVALRMLRRVSTRLATEHPRSVVVAGVSGLIGLLSAILGIGGGTLSVPFLARCGQPMGNAVAISGALGFPIALAGAVTYVALGWQHPGLPAPSLGYVYLPAFVGIILTSVLFAPLGARLAHRLPAAQLKRVFAFVILAIGGKLLWQGLARLV